METNLTGDVVNLREFALAIVTFPTTILKVCFSIYGKNNNNPRITKRKERRF
jgi:hypothetical protein